MRLWHYELIPYLPKSQLLSQWRELNSIYKKQDNHILINYIYQYNKNHLLRYSLMIIGEMNKRHYKINNYDYYNHYFFGCDSPYKVDKPFELHHNDRYLKQCFYNLQEKYDRGQKDFSYLEYYNLTNFIKERLKNDS